MFRVLWEHREAMNSRILVSKDVHKWFLKRDGQRGWGVSGKRLDMCVITPETYS